MQILSSVFHLYSTSFIFHFAAVDSPGPDQLSRIPIEIEFATESLEFSTTPTTSRCCRPSFGVVLECRVKAPTHDGTDLFGSGLPASPPPKTLENAVSVEGESYLCKSRG